MRIRFTTSARRHRVAQARTLYVIWTSEAQAIVTRAAGPGWLWIGDDQTGDELEVIGFVQVGDPDAQHVAYRDDTLWIIHAMPTAYRNK